MMRNKAKIHVIQCNPGQNQGVMNERGYIFREISDVQLLESGFSIVAGTPKVRVSQFVLINNQLREIRWSEPWGARASMQEPRWVVTLHGNEELPADLEKHDDD